MRHYVNIIALISAIINKTMIVEHESEELRLLEMDPKYGLGLIPGLAKTYRKRMQTLRSAKDVRDIYAAKGCRFEKLSGKRSHQHSIVLTANWRLIVEIVDSDSADKEQKIRITEIVDYH